MKARETVSVDITFGEAASDVRLRIFWATSATGYVGSSSTSTAGLSHLATRGGFVEVRDAGKNVISRSNNLRALLVRRLPPVPR